VYCLSSSLHCWWRHLTSRMCITVYCVHRTVLYFYPDTAPPIRIVCSSIARNATARWFLLIKKSQIPCGLVASARTLEQAPRVADWDENGTSMRCVRISRSLRRSVAECWTRNNVAIICVARLNQGRGSTPVVSLPVQTRRQTSPEFIVVELTANDGSVTTTQHHTATTATC